MQGYIKCMEILIKEITKIIMSENLTEYVTKLFEQLLNAWCKIIAKLLCIT